MTTAANAGRGDKVGPGAAADRPDPSVRPRRAHLVGAVVLLVAGAVALSAALTPWWYTRTTSAGTSSTAEFYPGGSFYAGGGGGGGTTTYAAYGLALVGALYEGILAGSILLTLLAWASAGRGFLRSVRRSGPRRQDRTIPRVVAAGLALAVGLLLAVPLAQPSLYRSDDPGGSCAAGAATGPCSSFWGSAQSSGASRVWGAGTGWWLDLVLAVLLAFVFVLWVWQADPGAEAPDVIAGSGR